MPVVGMAEIVGPASAAGRGVGAFNIIGIEHAEAIIAGAEAAGAPVVVAISQNTVRYHGALEPIARAALAVAASAAVPVAVHLDHATDEDLVRAAVAVGVGSVMFDASVQPYERNVLATAAVARWCHERRAWVEAEIGEIGGKDGAHHPRTRTRPAEAAAYAAATSVDALAVAVGSSHAMLTRDAVLDLDLIAEIHRAVPVPLVLHGSSGVPDDELSRAVAGGLVKINVGTALNAAYTAAMRRMLDAEPTTVDPRGALTAARDSMRATVAALLKVVA
jgi:fructose-bisphosphate aldolase class II